MKKNKHSFFRGCRYQRGNICKDSVTISGFTLIEILVVIIVVGILAKVAVSSFNNYILLSRRADGVNTLLAISLAEERYRTTNTTYGTLAQVWSTTTSPQGYYTLTSSNVSATAYTITATGVGNQANDTQNGTACSPLVISLSNGTLTNTPAACWSS